MSNALSDQRVFAGRYEIVRELGAGEFGEVYEVIDHHLGRRGALKLLRAPSLGVHAWAEAKMLTALDGPFILQVHNADVFVGQQFIVTELAENGTVADRIVADVGMSVNQARAWARDAAQGLARIHQQGLLHCDVKPANLFVTTTEAVVVGDVGLAQPQDVNGRATAAGSVETMAPEVAAAWTGGNAVVYSVEADVYSLGATLYWMIAGRPVRHESTPHADVAAMTVPDLWDVAPHVVPRIRNAVMTAIDPDPSRRFRSVAAFDSAIGGLAAPPRVWDRVAPHLGHEQCFTGVARTSVINLCTMPGARRSVVRLEGSYGSGRALKKLNREVRRATLPAAIRSAMHAVS